MYTKLIMYTAKPFVKWAGGKTQLLEEIRKHYPSQIEKYCEPFVGGGAVLFDVLQKAHPEQVLINDINRELVNTYIQVKNNCDALIAQLSELQTQYRNQTLEENKNLFYEKRDRFNELKLVDEVVSTSSTTKVSIEKAALFIFLNKTCFNGLYRVNSKGAFNVPFNSVKNPLLCDEENLRACSALLQNVKITCGDYKTCAGFCDEKTFVYIDPPYRPLTKTAAFFDELGVPLRCASGRAIRRSAIAPFFRYTSFRYRTPAARLLSLTHLHYN